MRVPIAFSSLLFVFSLLFLAGCAKEPTPVGARILPGGDLIKLDTSMFRSVRCYSRPNITQTATSPRVLIGTVDNLQSWGLYRFSFLPDSIATKPFVSAELNLRTIYHFGDSTAPFSFTVHQILQNWGTDSLTIDSLKAPGFYKQVPCGSYSTAILGDTVSISVPLDTASIRSWGTISDSVIANFGLLLKPTNSRVVKGFGSFLISDAAMLPRLLLRFRNTAGSVDTLSITLGTHRFVTTGPNPLWPSDSTHLYVMNGTSSRGYVEFDVSALPPHAAIHKAILELTPDTRLAQSNYFTVDSLQAFFIGDDEATLTYTAVAGGPVIAGTSRVYQFSVGTYVQQWLRVAKQRRIAIAGYSEEAALDVFAFHGTTSNAALRPKLTVIYSLIQ